MNRSQFLKALGISALSPMVLTTYSENKIKQVLPVFKFNPKQWPIYPDTIQYGISAGEKGCIKWTIITYVKIERNSVEYLIPVKEIGIGDVDKTEQRFQFNVKMVQDNYIVDTENQWAFDNKFVIKYDKNIHK